MISWKRVCIAEVCESIIDCINKTAPKIDEPSPFKMIRTTNIRNGQINLDSVKYVTEKVYRQWTRRQVPQPGDVLLTREAPMGEVGMLLTEDHVFLGQRIVSYRTNPEKLYNKFLLYAFQSKDLQDQIQSFASGSTVQHMRVPDTKALTIPIPPLAEQKRIVAILDEAFEGIEVAIANTEKNLTNARELFESYLNAIFICKGDDWVEKKVSEIGGKVFTGPFGSLLHKADYISNGIPIVNPANIEDGEIVPNWKKTVSPAVIKRLQSYVLSQNDIVIGRRGEIGRCAVVREQHAGWLCGSGSFFIKTFENVNSDFLVYLFSSAKYRSRLEAVAAGATMQNLSNQALSGLVIAMPPLAEQKRVTEKLEDLKVETQRLEAIYQQKLAALNELKQSILQKAFSGELTAETANQVASAAKEVVAA